MSVPVISVQSGYAQNSEFANQFPSANSGQGQSEFGNPINSLPPTQLRSGSPECTKKVDTTEAKLNALVLGGLVWPGWAGVAGEHLARFMDGKGGVEYIDSEWLRSYDKVKALENSLRKDINSRIEEIAPTLADGKSTTVGYSLNRQIIFTDSFHKEELFWASGTSTIGISVNLYLSRNGDNVRAHADVFMDWYDPYNWKVGKSKVSSVYIPIPGIGRIYDKDVEMLEVCKGAKPFLMKSSWKLNFDTNVKVAEEPVGGEQELLIDTGQCKGMVIPDGMSCVEWLNR